MANNRAIRLSVDYSSGFAGFGYLPAFAACVAGPGEEGRCGLIFSGLIVQAP